MKRTRTWIALALALCLALSLSACSPKQAMKDFVVKAVTVLGFRDENASDEEEATKVMATAGGDVTFPEGFTVQAIANRLEEYDVCSAADFLEAARNVDTSEYEFLADIPSEGAEERYYPLEGFIFPDTYEFYVGESAENVLGRFLDNFENRLADEELTARMEEQGLTLYETITLASIIQRESSNTDNMGEVSSVFHNRLNSTQYPLLQSCATVQYVLQERKPVLTYDDIKIDSPYNTYLYEGLPIGPIASPGLASIRAALYPETTDYYFFVVTADGTHIFSKTLAEHNAAVKQANSSRGTGAVSG